MSETAAAPAPSSAQTQTGGDVHSRIKAILSSQSATPEAEPSASPSRRTENPKASSGGIQPRAETSSEEGVPNEQVEGDDVTETDSEDRPETEADETDADDAQSVEAQLSNLSELADAIGWDLDKVLDLSLPTKIDGKEGTARLRDMLKSYQLDGHINQKLASLDTDRKTFESKRQETERAVAERLLRLDAGVKTLERSLMGEFANVDWQKLQAENPLDFNAKFVGYQTRYAQMQDIANQIAQEQQKFQEEQQAKAKERFQEEFKLLQAKVPEWSDSAKRSKEKTDTVEYLKALGISQQEYESIADHRHLLVVRDALKWHQLQKSKPTTLNKVKAAPKLLKPGAQQSRAVVEGLVQKREKDTLRQTGKVRDAVPLLKRQLFGGNSR
jgi:hypothetical protein